MHLRLAMLGCGNVGQNLLHLLATKEQALQAEHDMTLTFTGARTRSAGGWIAPEGISAATLAKSGWPRGAPPAEATLYAGDARSFLRECPADVVVELTTLQPITGQPALDHVRTALEAGRSVVTANKGPIAHAYRELRTLAARQGVQLRFESTVMDGTPIFNMVEHSLPVTEILGFRGLLNSTTNYVLRRMANGEPLEAAVAGAQAGGFAEADPSYDLEGWDASVKGVVLANVLLGADAIPQNVQREGLGAEAMRAAQAALTPGQRLRQVVECRRKGPRVLISVRLSVLGTRDLLAHVPGTALVLETDTMHDLTIVEGEGGPEQTAFGVLADLVAVAHARRHA